MTGLNHIRELASLRQSFAIKGLTVNKCTYAEEETFFSPDITV